MRAKMLAGTLHAKTMLKELEKCRTAAIRKTGYPDLYDLEAIIFNTLAGVDDMHGLALGLADYISQAMDGDAPTSKNWNVLEEMGCAS